MNISKKEKIWISVLSILAITSFFLDDLTIGFFKIIKNSFFDYSLSIFSHTFSLFLPLLIFTSIILYFRAKKRMIFPLFLSAGITIIVAYGLKFLVHRERQMGEMFTTLFHLPDYSFPSAHAAISFTVLGFLFEEKGWLKIFWITLAVIIPFSRIYFSYHYFSDVMFGALIGFVIGLFCFRMFVKKY